MSTVHARCGCGYLHPVRLRSASSMSLGSPQRALTASPAPHPVDEDRLFSLEVVSELSEKLAKKEEELEAAYGMATEFERVAEEHRGQRQVAAAEHEKELSEVRERLEEKTQLAADNKAEIAMLQEEVDKLRGEREARETKERELEAMQKLYLETNATVEALGRQIMEDTAKHAAAQQALERQAADMQQQLLVARGDVSDATHHFTSAMDQLKAELEAERANLAEEQQRHVTASKQLAEALLQLQQAQGEVQVQASRHIEAIVKLQDEHAEATEAAAKASDARLAETAAELTAQRERDMARLQEQAAAAAAEATAAHEHVLADLHGKAADAAAAHGRDVAEMDKEAAEMAAAHEREVAQVHKEAAEASVAHELAVTQLRAAAAEAAAAHEREAAQIRKEAAEAAAAHAQDLSDMQEGHAEEATRIEGLMYSKTVAHREALEAMQKHHADAVEMMQKQHAEAMEVVQGRHIDAVQEMKDALDAKGAELADARAAADQRHAASEERLAALMRETRGEERAWVLRYEEQVEQLRDRMDQAAVRHADEERASVLRHEQQVEQLHSRIDQAAERHAADAAAKAAEFEERLAEAAAELAAQAAAFEARLEEAAADKAGVTEQLVKDASGHLEILGAKDARLRELEDELEETAAALGALRDKTGGKDYAELLAANEVLAHDVEALQASAAVAALRQTELDDVLQLVEPVQEEFQRRLRELTDATHEAHDTLVSKENEIAALNDKLAILNRHQRPSPGRDSYPALQPARDVRGLGDDEGRALLTHFKKDVAGEVVAYLPADTARVPLSDLPDATVLAAIAKCREAADACRGDGEQARTLLARVGDELGAILAVHHQLPVTPVRPASSGSFAEKDSPARHPTPKIPPSPRVPSSEARDILQQVGHVRGAFDAVAARAAALHQANSAHAASSQEALRYVSTLAEELSQAAQHKAAGSSLNDGSAVVLDALHSGLAPASPAAGGEGLLEGVDRARAAADMLRQYIVKLEQHVGALESEASTLRVAQGVHQAESLELQKDAVAFETSKAAAEALLESKEDELRLANGRLEHLTRQLAHAVDEERLKDAHIDELRQQLAATDPSNPDAQTMGSLMGAQPPLTPPAGATPSPFTSASKHVISKRSVTPGRPSASVERAPPPVSPHDAQNTTVEEGGADDPAAMSLILTQLDRAEQELKALRAGRETDEQRLSSEIRTLEHEVQQLHSELAQRAAEASAWAAERRRLQTQLQSACADREKERSRAATEISDLAQKLDALQKQPASSAADKQPTPNLDTSINQPAPRGYDVTVLQTPVLLDDVLNHTVMTEEMTRWRDRLLDAEAEYNTARRARDALELQMPVGGRLGPEHPAAAALARAEEGLDLLATIIRKQTALDEATAELTEVKREAEVRLDSLRRSEMTVQELRQRVNDAAAEALALRQEKIALEARLTDLEIDCQKMSQSPQRVNSASSAGRSQVARLQSELASQRTTSQQQLEAAMSEAQRLKQENLALEARVTDLEIDCHKMSQSPQRVDSVRSASRSQVAGLQSELRSLRTASKQQLDAAASETQRLRSEVSEMEAALQKAEEEKAVLSQRASSMRGDLQRARSAAASQSILSAGAAAEGSQVAAYEREIQALSERNTQLEEEYAALLQELSAIQTEVGELQTTVGGGGGAADDEVELVALVEECDMRRPKSAVQKPTPILERLQRHLESLFRELAHQTTAAPVSDRVGTLQSDLAREVSKRRSAEAATKRLEKANRLLKQRFTREETLRKQLKDATQRLEELRLDNADLRKIVHTQELEAQDTSFKLKVRENTNSRAKRTIKDLEGRVRASEREKSSLARALTPESRSRAPPRDVSPFPSAASPRPAAYRSRSPHGPPPSQRTMDNLTEVWTEEE